MNILTNKKVKIFLTIAIYAVIILFIVLYIRDLDFSQLSSTAFNWWYILLAIPFSILSRVFLPYIWVRLIRIYERVDDPGEYWQLNYVYAKSWLGRYIPGKVAWIGGKIFFALKRGISKTVLGVTSIVEAILQLLTALLLGVGFLFVSGAYANFSIGYILFFLGATVVGLISITPYVFNRIIKLGYKLAKKKTLDNKYLVKLGDITKIGLLYCGVQALSALPIYFLVKAIGYDLSFMELLYISGAFIFAGAVGTLAFFTPSGLGVREGVILLFLANVLPTEISVVIVIVLRLWSIALDLLYWVLSYLLVKIIDKRKS
jgi:glycosyltransferase 2 family protein